MFLFDWLFPKKTFLYLDRQSLLVLDPKSAAVRQVTFPAAMVSFLDVYDPVSLEKTIKQFLHAQKLSGKVIMVLSENLLFDLIVPTAVARDKEKFETLFTSSIPFAAKGIALKHIPLKGGDKVIVVATNRTYFHVVVKSLVDFGLTVDAVVPEIAFGQVVGQKVSQDVLVRSLLKNGELISMTNYLA